MPFDDADIRWLLSLAECDDLAEIEVRDGESEVLVRRHDPVTVWAGGPPAPVQAAVDAEIAAEPILADNIIPVLAPMSGVYYRSPSPDSPPYAEVGQRIEQGDTIGLIEAMKLFNDVTAQVSGTVHTILVDGEKPVEAGQRLLLIET